MAKSINIKAFVEGIAYLKSEIDTMLAGKANAEHSHDDKYYTESEIDTKISTINGTITDSVSDLETSIATKADGDHNHDSTYAPLSHNHTKSDITDFAHTHTGADVLLAQDKTLTTKIGEIDSAISALQTADWDIEIVTSLPNEGVAGKLYFLHDAEEAASGNGNAFDEYIYDATNERFEKLGQRKINLSNYVTDVDIELSEAGTLTISTTKGSNAFAL